MQTVTETGTVAVFGGPVPVKQAAGIVGAVAAIASRDMARGALCGVHMEYDPDTRGIILTATDAYRLLSVTVPSVAGSVFEPVTVYARELATAIKERAKGADYVSVSHVPGATDKVTVTGGGGSTTAAVNVSTFANYRKLFDFPADSAAWPANDEIVNVNPELWAGLLSSCATISSYADRPKDAPLPETRITRMSAGKVTMITGAAANGVTFRGLVMPLRK